MADIDVLFQSDDDLSVDFNNSDDLNVQLDGDDNTDADMDEVEVVVSTDHRELRHKDAADQHPISSITGLQDTLNEINEQIERHIENAVSHITEEERTSWNNKSRVYRNASGALVISV